jgi:DNA-binding NtrC family response regulator
VTFQPAVMLGLRVREPAERALGERLAGWVAGLGYEPRSTTDADQALAWLRTERFAASLLDCEMGVAGGGALWRALHPNRGQRLVLLARERRSELWFEALRAGVAAVLPWPAGEAEVRAALAAAAGAPPWRRRGNGPPGSRLPS